MHKRKNKFSAMFSAAAGLIGLRSAGIFDAEHHRTDIDASRTFCMRADSYNENERSIEAILATENPVMVMDWRTWQPIEEVLVISGLKLPKRGQVPLCDTHDRSSIFSTLGSTRNIRIEGKQVVGKRFFDSTEEGKKAEIKVSEGHITDGSIGYRIKRAVMADPGKTAEIEGVKYTASSNYALRVVLEWQIIEDSLCPVGADPDAKMRTEHPNFANSRKESTMKPFKQWLQKRGYAQWSELSDAARTLTRQLYKAETGQDATDEEVRELETETSPAPAPAPEGGRSNIPAPAAQNIDVAQAVREGIRQYETERQQQRAAAAQAIRELAGDTGDIPAELVQRCIDQGMTRQQASEAFLGHMRQQRSTGPGVIIRASAPANAQQIAAAIALTGDTSCLRSDDVLVTHFGEETINRADQLRRRNMMDMAEFALALDGDRREFHSDDDLIRAAFSSNNLQLAFSNVANLFLLNGWADAPSTWEAWCQVVDAQDFKQHTGFRLDLSKGLQEISGAHGEIKHGRLIEEGEYFTVSTFAELLAIARNDFINDSKNALSQVPYLLGQAAREQAGDVVYKTLLNNPVMRDGKRLFSTEHNNLLGTTALSSGGLSAAKTKFRQIRNMKARKMNNSAQFIIVPDTLEDTMISLLTSDTIVMTGTTDATAMSKNIHKGSLQPVVEARLNDTSFHSGGSDTTWFLAGPRSRGAIASAYLRGNRSPIMTPFNPGPDYAVGGMIWQILMDFGAAAMEHRNMEKITA